MKGAYVQLFGGTRLHLSRGMRLECAYQCDRVGVLEGALNSAEQDEQGAGSSLRK
jgi:hypothetical protein